MTPGERPELSPYLPGHLPLEGLPEALCPPSPEPGKTPSSRLFFEGFVSWGSGGRARGVLSYGVERLWQLGGGLRWPGRR